MTTPIDTTTLMTMDRMVLQGLAQTQQNHIIALEATIEQMRTSAVQAEKDYQDSNGSYRAIVQRWERVVRYVARLRRERSVQDGLAQQQAERIVALEGEVERLTTGLRDLEWRKERTVVGTLHAFCPVCHGSPSHVRLNPHLAPRGGHRATCKLADMLGYPAALSWSAGVARAALTGVAQDASGGDSGDFVGETDV